MRARLLLLLGLLVPLLAVPSQLPTATATVTPATATATGPATRDLAIEVLSNRRDLVSGGDVLVEVVLPRGVRPRQVRLTRNGQDVTGRLHRTAEGRLVGLVRGLRPGGNVLRATVGDPVTRVARTRVVDHPNGGPVFTGPQAEHYRCQDTAVSAACDEPASYRFFYKSTDPTQPDLEPYDRQDPPPDVATTTTDEGVTVPFVVRREYGYQDRDRYTILQLWQPGQRWRAWAPQEQWNHKLLITHGGNCGASYTPGDTPLQDYAGTLESVPGVEPSYVTALGRGFGSPRRRWPTPATTATSRWRPSRC